MPKKLSKKEQKEEAKRLRVIVKDQLFPLLLEKSGSIKDAKNICKTLVVGMDATFAKAIREYQEELSELALKSLYITDFMKKKSDYEAEWAIAELLENESVANAKMLLDGLEKEITRLVDKELVERRLDTLKTEWL